MTHLIIDNHKIEVPHGTTVLAAADSIGIRIPRFCYHPRLTTPGNCRMCMVEIDGDLDLALACRTPVREGMIVRTDTPEVKQARADVLEFMLLNHPLDCPICDKSGECDLQNIYFEHSLQPSRLTTPKVKKRKAVRIGQHIMLDSERCVECGRCVRFCEEILGKRELDFFNRGDRTEISCSPGADFSNPYSLCTVDLCPVGALTSVDFRFKKRVWKLLSAPTICIGCSRGCNVWLDHADGAVYRLRPRENEKINKSWMCDHGHMSYKNMAAENRILSPFVRQSGEMIKATWDEAIIKIGELFNSKKHSEIICVLSARSSIEENEAFAKLCREKFGATHLYFAGEPDDSSFADSFLRMSDKNPNTRGISSLAKGKIKGNLQNFGAFILDVPASNDLVELLSMKPAWIVLITSLSKDVGPWAKVVLPKATYLEQDGTFVNANGISQHAQKIFEPMGESMTISKIAEKIKQCLNF